MRLGELDFDSLDEDAAPRDYMVAGYIAHPGYEDPQFYHDIGLVKLTEAVVFDLYKHPACLPFQDERFSDSFIAVGWGTTGLALKPSAQLLKVKLQRYGNWVSKMAWAITLINILFPYRCARNCLPGRWRSSLEDSMETTSSVLVRRWPRTPVTATQEDLC